MFCATGLNVNFGWVAFYGFVGLTEDEGVRGGVLEKKWFSGEGTRLYFSYGFGSIGLISSNQYLKSGTFNMRILVSLIGSFAVGPLWT